MSHFQSHSLCNKLQKWMNLNSLPSVHSQNTHCSHSHICSHNNSIIMSSPYKKTTFETLLRRYPQNEDQLKSSRTTSQNDHKQNPKRTFQSRIIKYDNIKSKIDTNLGNIKQSKQLVPIINDENQNTENTLSPNQQAQNEKLTYQKPLIKKIKLNSEYLKRFQQPKDEYHSCVDVEDMITRHNFRPCSYEEKVQNGKTMFRINVAKKINLINKNEEKNIENEKQKQNEIEQINCAKEENAEKQLYSPIVLQNTQDQYDNIQKSPQQPVKLLNFANRPKFIFKQLGSKVLCLEENDQNQADNDIFTLDGYRILEDDSEKENHQNVNHPQEYQEEQRENQIEEQSILKEIQQNQNEESALQEDEEAEQLIIEATETIEQNFAKIPQNEISSPQKTLFFPQNQPAIINQISFNPHQSEQKQNQNQNILLNEQLKPNSKTEKQRTRKPSKPKANTKILTRSKQQKLNLFNQLSMRLLRKKHGQGLSHSELADRMLAEDNKIELKAFIQSGSVQSQRMVFDFNELTREQMRNTLVKYFAAEEQGDK